MTKEATRAKQVGVLYMRVCYAEDLVRKVNDRHHKDGIVNQKSLDDIDELLAEGRQAIKILRTT